MISPALAAQLDLDAGTISGAPLTVRRLSDLRGCFQDSAAYEAALAEGDPVVYTVATIEAASGEGQLRYGLGVIMPGKIGDEFYMTKGHLHSWRPAAEVYVGLRGEGKMLLEDERSGASTLLTLMANSVVYVPGFTAHRTINTGTQPLVYIGIYPSAAGHDYSAIAESNFRMLVVEKDGAPVAIERASL